MSDYQEAKKSTPAAAKKNDTKTQSKSSEQKAVLCLNCGASLPEGAIFCPECGFSLSAPIFCPNCGAETTPDADICQACGAWLLDGQCKFCYAPLDPNAAFCADCGNPKDGIPCPDCGILSIFDFCSKCGKPLTEGAALAIELAKNDPAAKRLTDSVQKTIAIEAELAELDALISSTPGPGSFSNDSSGSPTVTPSPAPPVKKSLFSDSQLSAIIKTAENREAALIRQVEAAQKAEAFERKQEEERKRAQEAAAEKAAALARKQAEERRKALEIQRAKAKADAEEALKLLQNKTFLTQQEARRFHNAMATLGIPPEGWLCNTYGTLHGGGPNECANPNGGGRWVYGGRRDI